MTPEYIKRWWKSPKGCYHKHKFNARKRGVAFLIAFEEWWAIWCASGKWDRRGRGRGQYVMARFGDQGAYERGNVRICLARENVAERNRSHPPRVSPEMAAKASERQKAWWAKQSPDERAQMIASRPKRVGYSHSAETRLKMRAAAKLALSRRLRNEQGQWARHRGEI
jgi:hypothetical protein